MELAEKIQIHLDSPDSDDCPFCPGQETEHKWKTFKGKDNDGGVLRKAMNNPKRCGYAHQTGAKPKDGIYPNQNEDRAKEDPDPIYTNTEHGDYGNEAHHCISGNEIMKGHAIEKVIVKGSDYKGDTGYTINNGANGVFLPSYPKKYSGAWGAKSDSFKYDVMKLAMASGKGQAHIGGHKGHGIDGYCESYPDEIKKRLTLLKDRVDEKSEECPFCVEGDGTPKKPFVPPYKINQWLDNLSIEIERKLTAPPKQWPYFISKYAKKYYKDVIASNSKVSGKKRKFS